MNSYSELAQRGGSIQHGARKAICYALASWVSIRGGATGGAGPALAGPILILSLIY